jgi:hypothetical protein
MSSKPSPRVTARGDPRFRKSTQKDQKRANRSSKMACALTALSQRLHVLYLQTDNFQKFMKQYQSLEGQSEPKL